MVQTSLARFQCEGIHILLSSTTFLGFSHSPLKTPLPINSIFLTTSSSFHCYVLQTPLVNSTTERNGYKYFKIYEFSGYPSSYLHNKNWDLDFDLDNTSRTSLINTFSDTSHISHSGNIRLRLILLHILNSVSI